MKATVFKMLSLTLVGGMIVALLALAFILAGSDTNPPVHAYDLWSRRLWYGTMTTNWKFSRWGGGCGGWTGWSDIQNYECAAVYGWDQAYAVHMTEAFSCSKWIRLDGELWNPQGYSLGFKEWDFTVGMAHPNNQWEVKVLDGWADQHIEFSFYIPPGTYDRFGFGFLRQGASSSWTTVYGLDLIMTCTTDTATSTPRATPGGVPPGGG